MLDHAAQRFLIPPFIMLFLVGIALFFMCPLPNIIPSWFTDYSKLSPFLSVLIGLIVAGTGLFAIGFLISNICTGLVRILAFCLKKPRGFSTGWSKDGKETLSNIYEFKNNDIRFDSEQCEQCFIGDVASSHVLLWMRRRWEYFAINSHCAFACIVAGLLTPFIALQFGRHVNIWWYCIVGTFFIMFAFNGYQARREVIDMDNFLVRNYKKIRDLRLELAISNHHLNLDNAGANKANAADAGNPHS